MTTSFRIPIVPDRAATRIGVDVTFLVRERGEAPRPAATLPPTDRIERVLHPTVSFYRFLYDTVGRDYCWWLRRVAPDDEIRSLLADPRISVHVLYRGGAPAGFFELDSRDRNSVNIAYFGLLPHAIGTGAGAATLHEAARLAEAASPSGLVRVNTCTADHPRALPNYLAAGFRPLRTVREIWDIPDRLGLSIPDRLRI